MKNSWTPLAALVALTLAVSVPTLGNGFIWDDDDYVTGNITLRSMDGLRRIWFELGAVPQYYPLVHTTYWLEYRLWGLHPTGYHATNVLLHAANALLVVLVLRRLQVPGAWLAGALFALHPVHVESVAWITERKNVSSAFFYLASLLAYLNTVGWIKTCPAVQSPGDPIGGCMPRRWRCSWRPCGARRSPQPCLRRFSSLFGGGAAASLRQTCCRLCRCFCSAWRWDRSPAGWSGRTSARGAPSSIGASRNGC